jgi:probable rRNA maturation factor
VGERSEPAGGDLVVRVVDDQADAVDVARLERLARHVLQTLAVPAELELSITCVDRRRIRELNEAHLGGDGPTDVLAFPIDGVDDVQHGVPGLLGDVILCPSVAADQAGDHGRTPAAELDLLLVHGILHLLGHDHATEDERTRMFGLTEDLLARFTVAGGNR